MAGFVEVQCTRVKTVTVPTSTRCSLCHCIRAGCGRTCSQQLRDAVGPGDAYLGRVSDKVSCLCTSFTSDCTRVVCRQPRCLSLVIWLWDVWSLMPSQTAFPPSTTTLPLSAVKDCKSQLLVLKSGVGLPSKCKRETKRSCLADT